MFYAMNNQAVFDQVFQRAQLGHAGVAERERLQGGQPDVVVDVFPDFQECLFYLGSKASIPNLLPLWK